MSDVDYSKKTAVIVKTTKKLVDDLLALNTQNRNVKKGHLNWLVSALNEGKFHLTTQAIGVSDKGVLLDGQHRLQAIREAGYPSVEILLVTGLDEAARIYIDQGAKRSTADMLKIVLNKSISSKMAAVINTHLMLSETGEGFAYRKDRRVTKPSLDDVVETMDTHFERLTMLLSAGQGMLRAGGMTAVFHYSLKHDHDKAIELLQQVRDVENLTKDMPAYRLRNYYMSLNKRSGYGAAGQLEEYKNTVTACLAHSRNESLISLRPSNSWEDIQQTPRNYRHNTILLKEDGVTKKGARAA